MEIFELTELCGCFLELLTLCADAGVGVSAWKVQKTRKRARLTGEPPETEPWKVLLWIFLPVAMLLTSIVLWKWVFMGGRLR